MRNRVKKTSTSKKRRRYLSPTSVVVATLVFAIGTVAVTSRQRLARSENNKPFAEARGITGSLKVAGHDAGLNVQDGERTPEEAARLAEGLGQVIDQSTEGLVEIQHPDGSVSMNLEDHFQNVTVARIDQRGNLAQSCVDNPQAAGSFFRISPELIEKQRRLARPTIQE